MTPLEGVVRLADQNAYSAFAARFLPHAGRRFVESFDGRTFSYDDLHRLTAQMAGLLARHGVRKGDRVAGLLHKSPEAIMLYFAAVRSGALYMPVSSALTPPEVAYLMRDAGPRVAICAPEREATLKSIAKACGIERIFTLDGSGRGSFGAEFAGLDPDFDPVACSGRDGNAIVYTSGTTGKPKGAVISNGLAVTNAIALGEAWQFDRDDVLLHSNPPAFSIFGTTTPVVACGASMILLPKFDAGSVVSLLPRATVFAGVPTYYSRLLERADFTRAACARMRLFITGSAPMRPDLFTAFMERSGHVLLDRYGLTETLLVTSNPVDGERESGDSGVPLPGVELRIVDDTGALVAEGEIGAIEVRQPYMFNGYWNAPEKTRQAFRPDGYFITGDFGKRTRNGHVAVLGRGTELIITGGLNVYPKEVEERINAFDNVSDCAVIGVPHPDFGEGVVAIVELRDAALGLDQRQLLERLRGELAGFKVPKKLVVLRELPRNALGKIQKNVLRESHAGAFSAAR